MVQRNDLDAASEAVSHRHLVALIPHPRTFARAQDVAERGLVAADDPEMPVAFYEARLVVGMLPAERREALILVGLGDLAYEEAVDICGCAIGTVESRESWTRGVLLGVLERGAYDRDGLPAGEAMRSILSDAERLSEPR